MAQLKVVQELDHDARVKAFQQAVNLFRSGCHLLADNELWAALDEGKRALFQLDRQLEVFKAIEVDEEEEPVPVVGRYHGRRRGMGVDVLAGAVKQARRDAGLSLRQLAGTELTGAAICLIEKGKIRPSQFTLDLIASRTGKPMEFFIAAAEVSS